jgi:hypothetical protein
MFFNFHIFVKFLKNVLLHIFHPICLVLPNSSKRKHPSKGERKKQRGRTKVQPSKQPKRGVPQEGKGTTKVPKPPPVT